MAWLGTRCSQTTQSKYITIANIYIPARDNTFTHYKTADTDIQHRVQYITHIPHSVLTGDFNAHSTLWHSYIDDHRGQLIADVISHSDHITLNTNTPSRVIANIYIPARDNTFTHYKTADTDIQHRVQYITHIPHSVLTGDFNAHSTLWHSYIDDHRGQLIADVISHSDHITLNTNTPSRVPNTTLQQTSSPDITTVSNTLYNRTSWTTQHALSSPQLTYDMNTDYNKTDGLSPTTRKLTGHNFAQTTMHTNMHTANIIFTNIILMADKHNIPKGKMHSNWLTYPTT